MTILSDNSDASGSEASYDARFVRVPMRDGVELGAILYRPWPHDGRLPTVMEMTPYLADNLHQDGIAYARAGFAFLAVDCRGRGGSGGEFEQWIHDGPDGARRPRTPARTRAFGRMSGKGPSRVPRRSRSRPLGSSALVRRSFPCVLSTVCMRTSKKYAGTSGSHSMLISSDPVGCHLAGSVRLDSNEAVFRPVSTLLGRHAAATIAPLLAMYAPAAQPVAG
jgi:hypothetical protein